MRKKKKSTFSKLNNYEIQLKWVGKRKMPGKLHNEYGFGVNPPITVTAKNMKGARRQLRLPKTVKIKKIRRS